MLSITRRVNGLAAGSLASKLARSKKYVHKDPVMKCKSVFPIYPPPGNALEIPGSLIRMASFEIRRESWLRVRWIRFEIWDVEGSDIFRLWRPQEEGSPGRSSQIPPRRPRTAPSGRLDLRVPWAAYSSCEKSRQKEIKFRILKMNNGQF